MSDLESAIVAAALVWYRSAGNCEAELAAAVQRYENERRVEPLELEAQ